MMVHHSNNVAAFKGNHVFYMLRPHGYATWRVSKASAAAPVTLPPAMIVKRGILGGRQIDGGMIS